MSYLLLATALRDLLLTRVTNSIKAAKVTSTQNLSIDLRQQSHTYFFHLMSKQKESYGVLVL